MTTKTIIMMAVAIVIMFQFLGLMHVSEPESVSIPQHIWTPTCIETHVPIAPIPIPTAKFVGHADGDRLKCGTCHTYPSFDEDNNPYKIVFIATPTPEPQREKDSFVKSVSNSPIPGDYYLQDCKLPTDQSMQKYLANSDWVDDYEMGGWDCSQMAAYMEFMLENCGYNVVIRVADVEGEDYGHAWILVEFKEGMLAYECTSRHWVYPSESVARSYEPHSYVYWCPSMYDAGVRYESIYDIWNDYKQYSNGEKGFLNEFGWWTN